MRTESGFRGQDSGAIGRDWLARMLAAGMIVIVAGSSDRLWAAPPPAALGVRAVDHPWDGGTKIDVRISLPAEDAADDLTATRPTEPASASGAPAPPAKTEFIVQRSTEYNGYYEQVAKAAPSRKDRRRGEQTVVVGRCIPGQKYWFRVAARNAVGELSPFINTPEDAPGIATRQGFDGGRFWLLVITLLVCGAIIAFILLARWGMPLKVREIAGLEAVEEAVGRATEMGRACLFVPGIQDMNEMQTIAGLTILSRIAQRAAEYDCKLETPTSKSLVMTAARETVEAAYLAAGRPDAYNKDDIYYVSDEQFAYVSAITGKMVREKPAACFYLGSFYAESLILAETGNAIGAIQVAGTAQPSQLPFFVAACDYTLIGEEFFAASAYLSKNPDQLGSLKGQDVGKLLVAALILVGVLLTTAAQFVPPQAPLREAAEYLSDSILHAGA